MTTISVSRLGDSTLLTDGGEAGALVRAVRWADTPLGSEERWPQSLRTIVSTCLSSRFPILIWWGPELVMLYNDAYAPLIGSKHPQAFGTSGRLVFPEIWDIIGPMLEGVLTRGEATWSEDQLLLLRRRGFPEECYFTFSYSPIRDETGVGGVFTAVTETTARIIGDRRLRTLRAVAERSASCRSVQEAVTCAISAAEDNAAGMPFVALYLFDAGGRSARLAASARYTADDDSGQAWPIDRVATGADRLIVDAPPSAQVAIDTSAAPFVVRQAAVLSVRRAGEDRPYGALVVGLSPLLPVDDDYLGFLQLFAGHVATAIANAEAYEAERRRVDELAKLDRAKTAFFSNVSHEFRTPLTLLLAPLEEAAENPDLPDAHRRNLMTARRNALRLLKLVNNLLDFSRIEAGRVGASFEPLDLGAWTQEIASTFRSACERAGLTLELELPPEPLTAYVDREMWEKIVLNLVSNAFKHTFAGGITIRVGLDGAQAVVVVRDSGVGIPADQLERVFDRFHRVPNTRSRTFEGTGIGLSLVQELVRLHGGDIAVESSEGEGSTFTIRIPLGSAHLAPERVAQPRGDRPVSRVAEAYVEEAARWLPDAPASPARGDEAPRFRVLVADDNADMRDYVVRLLRAEGWLVDAVGDGAAALTAVRAGRHDLLVSDVMLPGVDGLALTRRLRTDPATSGLPVILLSARAGEEARLEGLATGADDYLEKPFSARELVARVGAHLRLAAARAHAAGEAERARVAAEEASRAKSAFLAAMSHELRTPLNAIAGYADLLDLDVHGPLTNDQRATVSRIKRSEQHLLRLINDILDFAKIEAGRMEFDLEDVDLAGVVASVTPMIDPQLAAADLRLSVEVPAEVSVRADVAKLQQVLLNLLSNAVKFTPPGGEISITTAADPGAPSVHVRVRDTGVGIPLDLQDAVFEPFVQVAPRPGASRRGTGLGLAISRDLARGMGGDLRVQSAPGAGSTFTLTLGRSRKG